MAFIPRSGRINSWSRVDPIHLMSSTAAVRSGIHPQTQERQLTLRVFKQRPCSRYTSKLDELAPSHSITFIAAGE